MIMISGDHQPAAEAVAQDVGIDEAWGDLMREDKLEAIRTLREQAKVALVGDGDNDFRSSAISATSAVSSATSEPAAPIAIPTVVFAIAGASHLPFVVALSRHIRAAILQNVYINLGVVAFLLPATILGLCVGPAVAMPEGSTFIVMFNALQLLAYRDRTR